MNTLHEGIIELSVIILRLMRDGVGVRVKKPLKRYCDDDMINVLDISQQMRIYLNYKNKEELLQIIKKAHNELLDKDIHFAYGIDDTKYRVEWEIDYTFVVGYTKTTEDARTLDWIYDRV